MLSLGTKIDWYFSWYLNIFNTTKSHLYNFFEHTVLKHTYIYKHLKTWICEPICRASWCLQLSQPTKPLADMWQATGRSPGISWTSRASTWWSSLKTSEKKPPLRHKTTKTTSFCDLSFQPCCCAAWAQKQNGFAALGKSWAQANVHRNFSKLPNFGLISTSAGILIWCANGKWPAVSN